MAPSLVRFDDGLPDPQECEPEVIATCACGCGEEILSGYEHVEMDGDWFYDERHLMKYVGAEWRPAEAPSAP